MHEFSIAARILEIAREHALDRVEESKRDKESERTVEDAVRIDRIEVSVGEASHVNPDQLSTCLKAAATDTMAADATVEIEQIAPYAECDCGWAGEPDVLDTALAYAPDLTCPDCGTRLELSRGDSCLLQRLEITTGSPVSDRESTADRPQQDVP